jgi:hypothetical protein
MSINDIALTQTLSSTFVNQRSNEVKMEESLYEN